MGARGAMAALLAAAALAVVLPHPARAQQEAEAVQTIEYRIGAKDLIEIKVFELPELNQTVRVAEDGSISMSLLGKVDVKGLTAQEMEKRLAELLDKKYTQNAHVTVFIKEYQKVSVFGAVTRPGNYELVGPTTLLQLVSQAGGLSAEASNRIFILRQNAQGKQDRITVDMDQLVAKGDPELNIQVQPNDIINIPTDRMLTAYVLGEVRLPGVIQFKQSKQVTVLQAISQAGGLTEWASKTNITVKTKDPATGIDMQIRVNLKKIMAGKTADLVLSDGDVIIVH